MPDIELLADRAARLRRADNLTISGAVRRVLRQDRVLAKRSDFEEIVRDVCSHLQKRSTARQNKNRRLQISSPKIPEQIELFSESAFHQK